METTLKLYRVRMKTVVYGSVIVEAADENAAIDAADCGEFLSENWDDLRGCFDCELVLHAETGLDGEQLAVPDVEEVTEEELKNEEDDS
jgi:hypothetical protein